MNVSMLPPIKYVSMALDNPIFRPDMHIVIRLIHMVDHGLFPRPHVHIICRPSQKQREDLVINELYMYPFLRTL